MNFASEYQGNVTKDSRSYNDGIIIERRKEVNVPEKTKQHTIYVDSRDRNATSYPNSNDYTIELTEEFSDILSAELVGIEFKKTEYLINADNKTVYYTDNLGEQTDPTLTEGNYTKLTINEAVTALVPFTSSYNQDTKKFTLTKANNAVSIDFSKGGLGDVLGFTRKVHAFGGGSTIVSDKFANLDGEPYVLLRIEEFNNTSGTSSAHNDCLARIPIADIEFDKVKQLKTSDFGAKAQKIFEPTLPRLIKLRVRLLKRDGNLYRNNNEDHIFTLLLTTRFQTGKYML